MVNPSLLRQMGKQHEQEILDAARVRQAAEPLRLPLSERLGWSLVGLGVHIVLESQGRKSSSLVPRPH
jgi:hypothetical protein